MDSHAPLDLAGDPVAAVAAARAAGAADADPVAFGVIEALARRAAQHSGEARALMVQRLGVLLARPQSPRGERPADAPAVTGALGALSQLVDRLGRGGTARDVRFAAATPSLSLTHAARPAPLKSVVAFDGTWSRLRVEHRLRQALAQVPAGAGPLNSSHLVNRALEAMQAISPEYLDAFMTHIDTLQWLEQASGAGDLSRAAAAPADGRRRPPAKAGRKG